MTIKDVAQPLGVSRDVVKDTQKRNLPRRFARPKLHKLKQIAIDEISIGKGHRYLTIVLDLKSGAVVEVGEGKGAEALGPFWPRLIPSRHQKVGNCRGAPAGAPLIQGGHMVLPYKKIVVGWQIDIRRQKVRIEAVATDLSPASISAVLTHLPNAVPVFDHFPIIKLYNEGLSDLRRKLYRGATHVMDQQVLKGTRWLLLKNPENLDPNRREAERLAAARQLNQPLALALYLKENVRQIWLQADKAAAAILQDWVDRATASVTRNSSNSKSWLSTKPGTL